MLCISLDKYNLRDQGDDQIVVAADNALAEIPKYAQGLASFTTQLKRCYTELNNDHQELRKLRGQVQQCGALYKDLHLQVSKQFIKDLADWVGNYTECSFEQFLEDLDLIVEDGGKYQQQADVVTTLHTELWKDSQQLAARAKTVAGTLRLEQRQQEAQEQAMLAKQAKHAERSENAGIFAGVASALGVAFAVPTGGLSLMAAGGALTAAGCYADHHDGKKAAAYTKAVAASANARNAAEAADIISGPLASAVDQFIAAIAAAAAFFQAVQNEIEVYNEKAEEAKRLRNAQLAQENRRRIERHYRRMKKPAQDLILLCKAFNAKVPLVEKELELLEEQENSDSASYIMEWLASKEQQLKLESANKRAYLQSCLFNRLPNMTQGFKRMQITDNNY